MEEAVLKKSSTKFRGFVLSGYPSNIEEATDFFLEDPTSEATGETDEHAKPSVDPHQKVFKSAVAPDVVIVLSSSEENCQRRSQERAVPMNDNEFQKRMSKWKEAFPEEEDKPKLTDMFSQRGIDPFPLEVDDVSPEDLCEKIVSHLESKRTVYNFSVTPLKTGGDSKDQVVEAAPEQEDGAAQREVEAKRKKKEDEDRLEAIKKEEFVRLEKHSEPLRQYLMQYVVPTLTTGLIDVCRETPEDPVAYLSEYLSIFSTELVAARRRKQQAEEAKEAPPPAS